MHARTEALTHQLEVPHVLQGHNAGCGLGAICMSLRYHGLGVTVPELEQHRLVLPRMLRRHGIGPGRLGRIALTFGCPVTIVDPDAKDVGALFSREGGRWLAEAPSRRRIVSALLEGNPVVACIPDKTMAFEGCTHRGSHWITIHSIQQGELVIHDPAPWRKVTRCKPGYWESWSCSMIVIGPPR